MTDTKMPDEIFAWSDVAPGLAGSWGVSRHPAGAIKYVRADKVQTTTAPAPTKRRKCRVCSGWGYLPCECWPGDCICGFGDEECEACGGTGDADWNEEEHGHDSDDN